MDEKERTEKFYAMINNRDKIDDLFRENLDGYRAQPSNGLWGSIAGRFFPSTGRRKAFTIATIALILITAGILTWQFWPEESAINNETAVAVPAVSVEDGSKPPDETTRSGQPEYTPLLEKSHNETTVEMTRPADGTATAVTPSRSENAPSNIAAEPADPVPSLIETSNNNETSGSLRNTSVHLMKSIGAGILTDDKDDGLAITRQPFPSEPIYPGLKDDYAKQATVQFGVHFTPSVTFYETNPNQNSYQGELSINYRRSFLSVNSGVGVTSMKDVGYYDIRYSTYDSVGYYMNIVSFSIDPMDPAGIIFDLKKETVYDSIPHITINEKVNRYTYIDIPLSLGFKFYERKRLSLSFNAGVMFSFLVDKKEPTVDFHVSGAEKITIDRRVPPRLNTTWRVNAGLDLGYQLTGKASLHIEPVFEQFLRSVYSDDPSNSINSDLRWQQNKGLYMIGIKLGLMFNL